MVGRIVDAVKDVLKGKPLALRSSKWHTVRDRFLLTHNTCAACGGMNKLQVHHKQPFHLHPELELDPTNFITLCEGNNKCHLEIGHHGNWKSYNPRVVEEAKATLNSRKVILK